MDDTTVRAALYMLGTIGALSVICIGVLIAVLQSPDVAALAVLASIASGAVGGVAGMIAPRQQAPPAAPRTGDAEKKPPAEGTERPAGTES
jgi:predicted phage tail protein